MRYATRLRACIFLPMPLPRYPAHVWADLLITAVVLAVVMAAALFLSRWWFLGFVLALGLAWLRYNRVMARRGW